MLPSMYKGMINFSRGLVVLLICIFTLPVLFGMTGVWLAAPVTEMVTMLITAFFLRRDFFACKSPSNHQ